MYMDPTSSLQDFDRQPDAHVKQKQVCEKSRAGAKIIHIDPTSFPNDTDRQHNREKTRHIIKVRSHVNTFHPQRDRHM
jgi:hypothetical protein